MRVRLHETSADDATVTLAGDLTHDMRAVTYRTRTGALLRVGGSVRGAFDREHETFALPQGTRGAIEIEVERRALPQSGLPSGDGAKWRWLMATAAEPARRAIAFAAKPPAFLANVRGACDAPIAAVGHSHLDVAWLWTYDEAIRKSIRTVRDGRAATRSRARIRFHADDAAALRRRRASRAAPLRTDARARTRRAARYERRGVLGGVRL